MGNLFRKEAMDSQRDELSINRHTTRLTSPTLALSIIFSIGLIFTILWLLFGNIVNSVTIEGVVFPSGGIEKINVVKSGIITDVTVKVGDSVEVGDIIAIVADEEALNQIKDAVTRGADEATINSLRQSYYSNSVVVSKTEGTVVSVLEEGKYINTGEILAEIAASRVDNNPRQILAFLPTNQKLNIVEGCTVQVSPDYAPREKYGYINGYVSYISPEIISKTDAQKNLNIYNIPSLLNEDSGYIMVYINLLPDENSVSGLDWSENRSNNINVEWGTICTSSVVVSEMPPYKWLLGGES